MHLSELCRNSDIDVITARLRQVASGSDTSAGNYVGDEAEPVDTRGLWSYQDNDGRTAFHWAIALKNFDLARTLMQEPYNSPVLTGDEEWNTPFATACSVGAPLDLLREVLDRSVAAFAAQMKHTEAHPSDTIAGTADGDATPAPLHIPGLSRSTDGTPASIAAAVIDAEDATGQTALLLAAGRGHTAIVRFLVEHGADLMRQNGRGQSALHRAVNRGNVELVEYLVSTSEAVHAANKAVHRRWMDLQDVRGDSALFYASMDNNEELGRYLLRHGADRDLRNTAGKTFWEV
ncbi:Ankyrin repeats (many copies)/Ankyrin repeats (3 copies)/Ankyrin repeat [Novymonas esmeraldas]|uniref:Ankyrin repeats (Many copies)/Ankyrin repeats (3 copies)/Ankyrin repeat n=1 Tax=Novymonas esmeraldas TaxID=1808958 RepID=A0AAW0EVN7_9TRYP